MKKIKYREVLDDVIDDLNNTRLLNNKNPYKFREIINEGAEFYNVSLKLMSDSITFKKELIVPNSVPLKFLNMDVITEEMSYDILKMLISHSINPKNK